MKEYKADIGSWKEGKIKKVFAVSPENALEKFREEFIDITKNEDCVIQIIDIETGKCVYDVYRGIIQERRHSETN